MMLRPLEITISTMELTDLAKQLPNAKFPFLNLNYDFKDTPMEGSCTSL